MALHKVKYGFPVRGTLRHVVMHFDDAYPTQGHMLDRLRSGKQVDYYMSQAMLMFLREGDTFLDIGSHVGYYAVQAGQVVGAGGRVLAFEPNPDTFQVLLLNALANEPRNIFPINAAVSDRVGTAPLHISGLDEGQTSLFPRAVETAKVDVATLTLDHLLDRGVISTVRFVKIDAEGLEAHIIDGAARLLETSPPDFILYEMVSDYMPDEARVREYMRRYGYDAYLVRPLNANETMSKLFGENGVLLPLQPSDRLNMAYANILLTRIAL